MSKPIVKWVGGKRQLLPYILKYIPQNYNSYFEPFFGGGAVFFELSPQKAIINDVNSELINTYEVVKNNVDELIYHLKLHINDKEYYYNIRNFDRKENFFSNYSKVERASRFIYLNRTCFNGVYRVNKKGQYNVPYGKHKNPTICDEDNLRAASEILENVEILSNDFNVIIDKVREGDFVYIDPPYDPLSSTSTFVEYTKDGFDSNMQIRVRNFCDELDNKGVKFMLSNSNTNFIQKLYMDFDMHEVLANRWLNCKANGRGKITELLITNYNDYKYLTKEKNSGIILPKCSVPVKPVA